MPAKQILLDPLGLVLQPNDVGQYPPGALKVALNVHCRAKGLLQPFPAAAVYRDAAASSGYTTRRIFPAASKLLVCSVNGSAERQLTWATASATTVVTTPEITSPAFSFNPLETGFLVHRGRYYFLSSSGVIAFASEGAATASLAGFVAPRSIEFQTATTADGQAMPDDTTRAYRAIFVRKGSDGSYVKISPPSHALRHRYVSGGTANILLKVSFSDAAAANLVAGDVLELYATETQDDDVDPGATFLLCASVELSSGNLSSGYAEVLDKTPDAGLGAELYTNPGQPNGELAAKYPPPLARDVCWYKGHAFYAASALPGYVKTRIPGAWGVLATVADQVHGIGERNYTATRTNTSAVLTGLSSTDGLVFGQLIEMTGVPAGTTVLSRPWSRYGYDVGRCNVFCDG